MSFTEGNVTQVRLGESIAALDDKVGSFIVLIWPESGSGPSATFAVSKNDHCIDWKRLSCVRDENDVFIMPKVSNHGLLIHLTSDDGKYSLFNVKILG